MSGFVENISHFLSECRNDILLEVCGNVEYADLKTQCTGLYEQLQESIPVECNTLLITLIDMLFAINSMEDSYFYLCGLRDGNEPDIQVNPVSNDTPTELATYKRYADTKANSTLKYSELQTLLNAECRVLLDEYIKNKSIMTSIEKSYCYAGGLRDKKRLDSQFNPSATKEWYKLVDTFL